MPDVPDLETRVAALEAVVADMQATVATLQKLLADKLSPPGPVLRSQGMLDRPKTGR